MEGLDFRWFYLGFLNENDLHLVETIFQLLHFDLFPGLQYVVRHSFMSWAMQRATAPSQPPDYEAQPPTTPLYSLC